MHTVYKHRNMQLLLQQYYLLESKCFDRIREPVKRLSKNFGILLRTSMFRNLESQQINDFLDTRFKTLILSADA